MRTNGIYNTNHKVFNDSHKMMPYASKITNHHLNVYVNPTATNLSTIPNLYTDNNGATYYDTSSSLARRETDDNDQPFIRRRYADYEFLNHIVGTDGNDVMRGLGLSHTGNGVAHQWSYRPGETVNLSWIDYNFGEHFEGGKGDDVLNGHHGADILKGDDGNDIIISGPVGSQDQLWGGADRDVFILGGGPTRKSLTSQEDSRLNDFKLLNQLNDLSDLTFTVQFPGLKIAKEVAPVFIDLLVNLFKNPTSDTSTTIDQAIGGQQATIKDFNFLEDFIIVPVANVDQPNIKFSADSTAASSFSFENTSGDTLLSVETTGTWLDGEYNALKEAMRDTALFVDHDSITIGLGGNGQIVQNTDVTQYIPNAASLLSNLGTDRFMIVGAYGGRRSDGESSVHQDSFDYLMGTDYDDVLVGYKSWGTMQRAGKTWNEFESDRQLDGNDKISGFGGNDALDGGYGADRLNGGYGDDVLVGGPGNDTIDGGPGNDKAVFSDVKANYQISITTVNSVEYVSVTGVDDGTDLLIGVEYLEFDDTIIAATSPNIINGTNGNDSLTGTPNNDTINGLGGNDTLRGGNGNDTLNGGLGTDRLYGDNGADIFVFDTSESSGNDIIYNFQSGVDTIQIDKSTYGISDYSDISVQQFNSPRGTSMVLMLNQDRIILSTPTNFSLQTDVTLV